MTAHKMLRPTMDRTSLRLGIPSIVWWGTFALSNCCIAMINLLNITFGSDVFRTDGRRPYKFQFIDPQRHWICRQYLKMLTFDAFMLPALIVWATPMYKLFSWQQFLRSSVMFADKSLECQGCKKSFVFSSSEQEFYSQKNLTNEPKRCPDCRLARRMKNTGKSMDLCSQVPCDKCGINCLVPFKPSGIKPVLCSSCFHEAKISAASTG